MRDASSSSSRDLVHPNRACAERGFKRRPHETFTFDIEKIEVWHFSKSMRSQEKRERMTEQLRHITAVSPLGGDAQRNPEVATASHGRAAERGREGSRD
jgi:hypothetical protein